MKEFINNTKGLAKNPLGIIALFISLIYAFASLVLGFSVHYLEKIERLILICFLVIFPVIVLVAFVYLVVYHHEKLYSPADFRDDKNFLEASNREQKIKTEFEEQKQEQKHQNVKNKSTTKAPIKTVQKTKKTEIIEFNDFKEKYLKVEDLVIERIKKTYGVDIERNVRIKGLPQAEFDGVIIKDDEIIFIEIKYTISNHIHNHMIKRLKSIISQLEDFAHKGYLNRKITFYIFIVCETDNTDLLQAEKAKVIKTLNSNIINIKLDILTYNALVNE